MKELIDFKNRKWIVYGGSAYPVFLSPCGELPSKGFLKKYGVSNEVVTISNGKIVDWLYDIDQLNDITKKVFKYLLNHHREYYKKYRVAADKFDVFHYRLMDTDLRKLNDKELISLMKRYHKLFYNQIANNNLIEPLSMYLQGNLRNMLVKEGLNKVDKLIKAYGLPNKDNYIKKCVKEYKKLKNKKKVNGLLKKYHYINNDYTGAKKFTEKDLKNLVLIEKENEKTRKKNKPKVSNKKAKKLLNLLQQVATIQDVRKAQILMWDSGADKLIHEFAKRKKIEYKNIIFATWNEVILDEINEKELIKRSKGYVISYESKKTKIYTGKDYNNILKSYKKYVFKDIDRNKIIKGFVACNGKATGKAKIILSSDDFNKVKRGDILVSMMTRPEYLSVMRLASAIITDEGGITSHAAIVSREMNKPCIIGTKIATKVLKDGDLVEVDANNGIIKILKRKK